MLRCISLVLVATSLGMPVASAAEGSQRWRAVWQVSRAMLVGANTADIATSWGKNEANPMLRAGARFSYGDLAIKLGVLTGSLTAQHYILRKAPQYRPFFASANLAAAGALGYTAWHNTGVPR